ncbi:MAG: Sec-independent protein translocase subunit TatB [Actinobacteria bacterium]|nr:MAG: Sec-independent protein translocase subunit TatB [Actinomycetota bacterium]
MFGLENLNSWHLMVLALLGIFIFGPDRLPKAIADGVRMLRNVRNMARNATSDLSRELGTEITLEDLHPKTLLRKHLLSEEDEQALRRPLEDLYRDVKNDVTGIGSEARGVADGLKSTATAAPEPAPSPNGRRHTFDADAT